MFLGKHGVLLNKMGRRHLVLQTSFSSLYQDVMVLQQFLSGWPIGVESAAYDVV